MASLGIGGGIGSSIMGAIQKAVDSKEYLVEGAKLMCVNGLEIHELLLPDSHYYTSGGKKKSNCKDCKACINIPYFGECKKNEDTHKCEGFMELEEKWENTSLSSTKAESVGGEDTISMSSVLLCKKGGIIIPLTSGQGYDKGIDWAAFSKRFLNVFKWVAGKDMTCRIFGKDPINMNTGNFIYEKEDLYISGIMPLEFKIFYNAMSEQNTGSLGQGWNHNYEINLDNIVNEKFVSITLEDGRGIPYQREIRGEYTSVMGDCGVLKNLIDGYSYETEGLAYYFNRDGQLVSQSDINGNYRAFHYNEAGMLKRVCNVSGASLDFFYNQEKNLIQVIDNTGRKVSLVYEYGKLRWFTNASGLTYTYNYNDNGKLEEVVNPSGIFGMKNEYDGTDRVVKQTMPDGGVVELRYDDKCNRTYMKEQNGNMVIYESDEKLRNIRTIHEDGEEFFGYNDKNQRVLHIDKKGNKTKFTYDNRGNMTQAINALGEKISMTYDSQNRLICRKLPDGNFIKYKYDRKGNLIQTTNPMGYFTSISYEDNGQVKAVEWPDDSVIGVQYDENGNIACLTDAMGNKSSYVYDQLNRVITDVDGNGNSTHYKYNTNNDIIEIVNSHGNKKIYDYNDKGKVTSITDFDGSIQRIKYDKSSYLCSFEDKEGNITLLKHDNLGNISEEKYPNGGTTSYVYNHQNKVVQFTNAQGEHVKFEYDVNGNQTKITGADGNEIRFEYDALNRKTKVHELDGGTESYEYNERGNISKIVDPMGNYTLIEYDACGRKSKETDIYGNVTTYTYNSLNLPLCITDGAGRKSYRSYYPGGLLKRIEHENGNFETYIYDKNYNILETKNQNGYILSYTYDELNRITKICSNKGLEKSYTYDEVGNIKSMENGDGTITNYKYSPNGKLTSVTDALGNVTKYGYDCMGNLTGVFQPGNSEEGKLELDEAVKLNESQHHLHLTLYKRDLLGRVTSISNAMGFTESYEYNAVGNIIKKIDKEGYETKFTYKIPNVLESITYADGRKVNYSYNLYHQLNEIHDWHGITKIETDILGTIKSVTDYKGKKISYETGSMGERKSIIYPDGSKTIYHYDDCLRLNKLVSGDKIINYHYDKSGKLVQKELPNGFQTDYSYNDLGYISSVIHKNSNRSLDEYFYEYDQYGNNTKLRKNRNGLEEESGFYSYIYDPLNRLSKVEKDGTIIKEFSYDSFGNRINRKEGSKSITYHYNSLNELMLSEGQSISRYIYDPRGNLTQVWIDDKMEHSYEYSTDNRICAAKNSLGDISRYEYNGLGHRIKKQIFGTHDTDEISYINDITKDYHNLLQKENKGEVEKYIWDWNVAISENKLITGYYFQDNLGSVSRYIGQHGKLLESYGYDEFGCDLYENQGEKQPFGYTGYQLDKTSGTYFAQLREYDPARGRFISEDILKGRIGCPITLNNYNYCLNSPLNYIDLFGSQEEDPYEYWRVLIEQGNDAHATLREATKEFPGLKSNVYIPSGLKAGNGSGYCTPSGYGYADFVYYNGLSQEVYELKPDTAYSTKLGHKQLSAYVQAIGNNATKGNSVFQIFNRVEDSLLYEDRQIIYYTKLNDPGMIYYTIVNKQKEPAPAPVPVPEKEKAAWYERIGYGTLGIIALIGTGIIVADNIHPAGQGDDPYIPVWFDQAMRWFQIATTGC